MSNTTFILVFSLMSHGAVAMCFYALGHKDGYSKGLRALVKRATSKL
jgi:hypothetical protein